MQIQQDKIKHFVAGAIASAFVFAVTSNLGLSVGTAVVLGIAKEIWDNQGNGTVEVLDAVATALGGVVAVITIKAVMIWIR